jgi:photosystem II stability/assembly factor-like uncharacterized protein
LRRPSLNVIFCLACFAFTGASQLIARQPDSPPFDSSWLAGLKWRLIGPFRGGRVLAVTGVRGEPQTYYFGAVSGGVWKTVDGGQTWSPLTDEEPFASIGSIAVSDADPNLIYVGTGEGCPRGDVTYGDGVWKSPDAGKTWVHLGLAGTQTIPKIIVNPRNPSEIFVAALGHIFGSNQERGVFKSTDGGNTWKKVLYKDDKTGAVDVEFDPNNPHVLFAALWQVNRTPYSLTSGGPGSGLYKSTDDGETWTHLEGHGLPTGIWGRVGISVSGADSNRVYALIEAEKGGLYRSEDGGETWSLVNGAHNLWQRAWYYMHVFADPKTVDMLYVLDVGMYRSTDGGKTFETLHPSHGDNHALWIDPDNSNRMITGDDGGVMVSVDGGGTWTTENNQPTAQFYHIIADNSFPYRVYGAQQDNSTIAIATRSDDGVIDETDYYTVGGGESGYVAPYPPDPDIVYSTDYEGGVDRFDKRTRQIQIISPWPVISDGGGAANLKYRAQWTAPLIISPQDPNTLYWGAQMVLKSTDGGASWTAISPDLTRNDKSKQQVSGGPITKDDTGTEYYDTVFSIAESPVQAGLIWAGSDDGLVHLTRDGGKSWSDATPKQVPEWSLVSLIEASPFDAGSAYMAVDRHRLDDHRPYVFRTHDYGKTWTLITNGIPDNTYVHALREDRKRKGLLFAGTETGVLVSLDDGDHWQSLQLNLPVAPVHDLIVHDGDLVVATHGRSFWILDDISPLRDLTPDVTAKPVYLFPPRPAFQSQIRHRPVRHEPVGENPPTGATFYYYLEHAAGKQDEVKLQVLDNRGKVVRSYSNREQVSSAPAEAQEEEQEAGEHTAPERLPAEAGLNRFYWDLRAAPATAIPGYSLWDYQAGMSGPRVVPGQYRLRLIADGKTIEQPLEVKLDPRVKATSKALEDQFQLALEINRDLSTLGDRVNQIRSLHDQLKRLSTELAGSAGSQEVIEASKLLDGKLAALEEKLIDPKISADEDSCNYAIEVDGKLGALESSVESAMAAPTDGMRAAFSNLDGQLQNQLKAWDALRTHEVSAFNELARRNKIAVLVVPAARSGERGESPDE